MKAMISVNLADIPTYLRCGGFYQGLDLKEGEEADRVSNADPDELADLLSDLKLEKSEPSVSVPADALKADDSVTNNEDLVHLLATLRFWAVQRLSQTVAKFILTEPAFTASEEIKAFAESFPALNDLIELQQIKDINLRSCHAIHLGQTDALCVFHERGDPFLAEACKLAAQADQLDVLVYLISIGCDVDDSTCDIAAKAGSMKCLDFLYAHGHKCTSASVLNAAANGQLDILKFLHKQKYEWDASVCAAAARGGHLECLTFLHENGCPWDEHTAVDAASEGHLECLIYAHTHGAPMYHDLCLAAAVRGHLDCLKYAHDQGLPWNEVACTYSAQLGLFPILQYLHENGCPWDANTTLTAAAFGRYDCLKFAVEHSCPWDNDRWEQALSQAADPAQADALRENLKANCTQS